VKILTIASQKGGVGKTSVAVNAAYSLAKRGWRTLVVDGDPQGSVGLSLSRRRRKTRGLRDWFKSGGDLSRYVVATRQEGLSVLPAGEPGGFVGGSLEESVADEKYAELFTLLGEESFDVVIVDSPAGLHGRTCALLWYSDYVLIPLQAEPLAVRGISYMLDGLLHMQDKGAEFELAGIVLTMVQSEARESSEIQQDMYRTVPADILFRTAIPRDLAFIKASAKGVPLALLNRNPGEVALVFDQLAAELECRIGLHQPQPDHDNISFMD